MREIRLSGSEGGVALTPPSLPRSVVGAPPEIRRGVYAAEALHSQLMQARPEPVER
jgi:hypothetical protein